MRITHSAAQFEKTEKATKEFSKSSTCLMDSMSTDDTSQEVQNDNGDWANLPLNIELEDKENSD